jgi:EAL domain-containing protein (putative c-di-GMP-specific phosphodiesterase class I)
MENLNSLGVKIAIDDFGTGYSSLAYLKKFPIQKLKVDRTFVRDISCDPNDAGIVFAIIAMAHTLNLEVVAEGIETLDHLQFLKKTACEVGQGYLFSRPVPQGEFLTLIKETDGVFDAASAGTC